MVREGVLKKEFLSHQKGVSIAFSKVKDELTEHLEGINQNTVEIGSLQQYIMELEGKIEKLSERIDQLVSQQSGQSYDSNIRLTLREQEVFLALYISDSAQKAVELAQRLGLTEELVHSFVHQLISKSVPVMKKFSLESKSVFYYLDPHFKDLQARKNIIEINDAILDDLNLKEVDFVKK